MATAGWRGCWGRREEEEEEGEGEDERGDERGRREEKEEEDANMWRVEAVLKTFIAGVSKSSSHKYCQKCWKNPVDHI